MTKTPATHSSFISNRIISFNGQPMLSLVSLGKQLTSVLPVFYLHHTACLSPFTTAVSGLKHSTLYKRNNLPNFL